MRYLKKFEDVNNQPSDYEELVSIVRSYMDNQALDIIQEEAMKLPDNYYINVRLIYNFKRSLKLNSYLIIDIESYRKCLVKQKSKRKDV